jgi:prolipoprotein diacylglyceryltransferase
MNNAVFVLALGAGLTALLRWGFKVLPEEGWQILAALPVRKDQSGRWVGVNLTYYGLLTASGALLAILTFLMLMGSIGQPLGPVLIVVGIVVLCCLPATRLIARVVERKQHTSSVTGAVFTGMLVVPLVVTAIGSCGDTYRIPLAPAMAALTIAFLLGEGVGRLACISFGCCYGKPLSDVGPVARRLFGKFHFAFHGATKKIAYDSGLEGIKVVPVQALTSVLYLTTGLAGMLLFLGSFYRSAYLLTIIVAQVWRVGSETLRADYRGEGRLTAYQRLALFGIAYAIGLSIVFPPVSGVTPEISAGIEALWNPLVIIVLQGLWAVLFIVTGWSMVTGGVLSFHVRRDRI